MTTFLDIYDEYLMITIPGDPAGDPKVLLAPY